MAKRERKPSAQVKDEARKVQELVDGGMEIGEACAQVGLGESAYRRNATALGIFKGKRGKRKTKAKRGRPKGERGSIRADSLPPRPKRSLNGHGGARKLDLHSVESVARRIAKIDKALSAVEHLSAERRSLGKRLARLLQID